MNFEQKYKDVIKMAREAYYSPETPHVAKAWLLTMFPTIAESEDERIRKEFCKDIWTFIPNEKANKYIAWLEKQNKNIVNCQQNHQDVKYPNGGIVMEDFNGGEGFYKLHLDYLNKKQVEEVEEMVRMWNKESKISDENIINCIGMCLTDANEQRFEDYGTTLKDCLSWLNKQGKRSAEPNWCHHKVDLSDCSEEYRKAYYDGWNNCNMQHLQCEAESSNKDEKMKKAIMHILYENYTDAAVIEGVEIAEIVAWLKEK